MCPCRTHPARPGSHAARLLAPPCTRPCPPPPCPLRLISAFGQAKAAIDRREAGEKAKREEDALRRRKLKEMWERL